MFSVYPDMRSRFCFVAWRESNSANNLFTSFVLVSECTPRLFLRLSRIGAFDLAPACLRACVLASQPAARRYIVYEMTSFGCRSATVQVIKRCIFHRISEANCTPTSCLFSAQSGSRFWVSSAPPGIRALPRKAQPQGLTRRTLMVFLGFHAVRCLSATDAGVQIG